MKLTIKNNQIALHTSILAFLTIKYKKYYKNSGRYQSTKITVKSKSNSIDIKTRTFQNVPSYDDCLELRFSDDLKSTSKLSSKAKDCLEKKSKRIKTEKLKSREKKLTFVSTNSTHKKLNKFNRQQNHNIYILIKERSNSIIDYVKNENEICQSKIECPIERLIYKKSSKIIKSEPSSLTSIESQHKKILNKNSECPINTFLMKNNDDSDKFIFTNHLQIDHDSLREQRGTFLENIHSSTDLNQSLGSLSFTLNKSFEQKNKSNTTLITYI
jgi:hypothetical protein